MIGESWSLRRWLYWKRHGFAVNLQFSPKSASQNLWGVLLTVSLPATMPTQSQLYLSTRGGSRSFSFRAAVLKGLASDGGLFIPHSIPTVSPATLSSWRSLSFQSLAVEVLSQYISQDEIPREDLKNLVEKSYGSFRVPEVAPVKELVKQEGLWVLELWHGPTYAFKDVALQFLGNLFEYFLIQENQDKTGKERDHLTVLGATSGDTGR